MKDAKFWIDKLNLQKHPEGGWFKEVYRSEDVVSEEGLSFDFEGSRNFSTSIYYLLQESNFSAFHRIKSDELWHYYVGTSSIEIVTINSDEIVRHIVGSDILNGEQFQVVVPKNTWFAAHLLNRNGFALVGCTVSPGFYSKDFELAGENLKDKFPDLADEIQSFLRSKSKNESLF